jgi:nucleotide-binding universal stress UspA family protein
MLKDIMVHMDQAVSCQSRLEAAITLAKQHGSSLTGLYVCSSPRQKIPAEQLTEVRDMFQQQTAGIGLATDWIAVDLGYSHTGIAEMIGYYASFTDLLVVSQPLTVDKDKRYEAIASIERLLLGSGQPVLVVPRFGSFPSIGDRIMVAWKAGPKASRAMHDALPLLRTANQVNMVSVDTATFSPEEGMRLARYLAQHDVSAKIELIPPGDLGVGDTLLNLVADDNIDLLVLGVHIVTRRGKLDMGAIGSYLLGQMTVPMLLSH